MKLSDRRLTARLLSLLSVFVFLFLFTGCATLPNAEKVVQESPKTKAPPTIIGVHRRLSARQSRALIQRLKRQTLPTDILQRHIAIEESVSGSPLVAGNKVTLLVDGPATYAAMFKAIQNAKDHVNLESYIFEDDETGQSFAELLLQKEAQGVQVNLIFDSVGSLNTSAAFFQRLRDGGVQTLEFNPINPLDARATWLLTHRDHRKILIADGSAAITGGVNISSAYSRRSSGSGRREGERLSWRDTDVQIEGPAAAEFQKLFLETWKKEKGPQLSEGNYFPPPEHMGNELVRVIGSTPGEKNRITYMVYFSAISFAENFIHLTNSYFIPDAQILKALAGAAERGVDVKIILPAHSDSKLAFYAGRSYYSRLLKSGVKLFERHSAVLHAKTAVIDGVWSSVGSTNMDLWSFLRNDEVNAVILGRDFASQMEAMFTKDLENSDAIHFEEWKHRTVGERMKEWFSRLFSYWL